MADLTTGKIAEVMFDSFVETYEHQAVMVDLIDAESPDEAKLQNSGNLIWYPVQQHRPILSGFDLTGQEQGIIEETVPISLGDPNGDFIDQRIDNMRDMRFWDRAGKQAMQQQITQLNSDLARLVVNTGSQFFRYDTAVTASGFDFCTEGQTRLDEQEIYDNNGRCFLLNPRDHRAFASDLAGRQTLGSKADRSENAYATGNIGEYVASFDIYQGSFLPTLAGGASPDATVTATVSLKPEAGAVDAATGDVSNVDYRRGSIPVADSSAYNIGDKVSFLNGAVAVTAIGLASKEDSGRAMTFTVVAKPNSKTIEVFPKPIALDDPALTALEKAYANIDTQIASGAVVSRLNVDAEAKTNIFWAKDSIKMIGGDAPWQLMKEFSGKKVLSATAKDGMQMYMIYDGDIAKATFQYRLFFWYGLSNFNPMANGVGVTF